MCFNVARMFVQVTKCKHGSVTYFTYLVRESFRTPKGPRSRTICNITALPPETRELISQSLQGRSFVAAESLQLNGHWVGIEKQLYQKSFPQGVSLVLYDLTSVYFEGNGPSRISQYGHSRDHRSDRPQVLLAVATDAQGLPLHLEVLRGNRGDTTTLQGLLSTLRRRFGIREAVFVFDGGMSSKVNLEAMDELKLKYVTRLGASKLEEL